MMQMLVHHYYYYYYIMPSYNLYCKRLGLVPPSNTFQLRWNQSALALLRKFKVYQKPIYGKIYHCQTSVNDN